MKLLAIYVLLSTAYSLPSPPLRQAVPNTSVYPFQHNLDKFTYLKATQSEWQYDFTTHHNYTFHPGSVILAAGHTAPLMKGTGMAIQMLQLGPCATLPPHFHPRADNVVTAVHGTTQTWMYNENGAPLVATTLTPGRMTVFPRGSLHGMMNMGCSIAQLVSALNSEDPGTLNIFNGATVLSDDLVKAQFQGALSDETWEHLKANMQPVGTGANWGVEACYRACGIPYQAAAAQDFTFDDEARLWDGAEGTKEGYYDVSTGQLRPGVQLP